MTQQASSAPAGWDCWQVAAGLTRALPDVDWPMIRKAIRVVREDFVRRHEAALARAAEEREAAQWSGEQGAGSQAQNTECEARSEGCSEPRDGEDISHAPPEADASVRAKRADASVRAKPLLAWGRRYLPEHFTRQPSEMHRWMAEHLEEMRHERGSKLNVLGPRGGAKSTVGTLAYPLREALEGREPYIWIVSDTKEQARLHLANLKTELLDNPRIARDYPQAAGRGLVWRAGAIVLRNGVTIEAFGTGQRVRGRRRRENRPTLIVCDDLQNDAHIESALQRDHARTWFHGTLLKAGTPMTNFVNLATALHREALAMELCGNPGWTSRVFRSIDPWPEHTALWEEWEGIYTGTEQGAGSTEQSADGGPSLPYRPFDVACDSPLVPPYLPPLPARKRAREFYQRHRAAMDAGAAVLWPEVEDLYTLMCMRVESGRAAFEREKQNSPVSPELCEWPESYFGEHLWFDQWPGQFQIKILALDPSKGSDAKRGDYSAFVRLGVDRQGILYVEADLQRRPVPQIVADGVEHCRQFRPDAFGVEANQFQDLLGGQFLAEFRRQGMLGINPWLVNNDVNKRVRLRRLGPYLAGRRFRMKSNSPGTRLLVEQLRQFPTGDHDDGPDALEMAIRLAEEMLMGSHWKDDGLGDRLRL